MDDALSIASCRQAFVTLAFLSVAFWPGVPAAKGGDLEGVSGKQFFENRIRPVLVEHCYECHSEAAKQGGDLRGALLVDSPDGLLLGGDSGPAVVPGQPDKSLLLAALRYESYEMPPSGKLDDRIIADFETWISNNAPDPRASRQMGVPQPSAITASDHWAYQPIKQPRIPSALTAAGNSQIDSFLGRQSSSRGLAPAPIAERFILIRRLYYDLVGIPPTPEAISDFVMDMRPDATERLVDRLLASPRFGERWGRHWLDIVRFAESVTLRGLVQHEAWRYRDYVLDSLNADLPYSEFVRQQIAGDLLEADSIEQSQQQHIATTFLAMGDNNLEDQDKEKLRMDVIDEQLTVVGTAFLAQTIGCARCHDHKFDPIPTSDYYALAGIFRNVRVLKDANVSQWIDRALPIPDQRSAELARFEQEKKKLNAELNAISSELKALDGIASKSVETTQLVGIVIDNTGAILEGSWTASSSNPRFVGDGYIHDDAKGRGEKSVTFQIQVTEGGEYEVRLSYAPGSNRSSVVHVTVRDFEDTHHLTINQQKKPTIDDLFVSLGTFKFEPANPGSVVISNHDADGHVIVDSIQLLETGLAGQNSSVAIADIGGEKEDANERKVALVKKQRELKAMLDHLVDSAPEAPRYMGVEEEPSARDIAICIRGNVHQHGKIVPRGFLSVAASPDRTPLPQDQSGRVELAEWLVSEINPLTSRVIANRIWLWLFGDGIVRTPDNFGTTGLQPTHPELLDYLASRLVSSDWSIKHLVREVVLSEAYQRDSLCSEHLLVLDPENQLWLRQNRKRIEAECLIDSILANAQLLDLEIGGKTVPDKLSADYGYNPATNRRAIYWPVLRNAVPEIVRVFDGANRSLVTGKRNESTVAPQALLMLNDPWIEQQSIAAGKSFAAAENRHENDLQAIERVYIVVLGRLPDTNEQAAVFQFLKEQNELSREQRWSEIIRALWSTVDFRYLR